MMMEAFKVSLVPYPTILHTTIPPPMEQRTTTTTTTEDEMMKEEHRQHSVISSGKIEEQWKRKNCMITL